MIPYGRQSIDDRDIDAVVSALKSDWLTTGPLVEEFENQLASVVGAPTVSVTSGTSALHCAYAAIGIKTGDEVITPPITFIATQATAALMGAKILFADVQSETANIDPKSVEAAITSKTKAIVAVDYAGHPADLDELRVIADRNGIFLIEDAAHSMGSTYKGRPVGSIADITTFSFFPTKNMTTSEGGAVSSPNPDLLEKARKFSRQGLERNPAKFKIQDQGLWHQEVHHLGLNYRLPDVLCALGISQLARLPEFKERRREIFQRYTHELSELDWLKLPIERNYVESNWHLYPIRVNPKMRKPLYNYLREHGIGAQVNYLPAYRHPAFDYLSIESAKFPASEDFYASELSLPMYSDLQDSQIAKVVETLLMFK